MAFFHIESRPKEIRPRLNGYNLSSESESSNTTTSQCRNSSQTGLHSEQHLNISQLSFSDSRKLNKIRAKEAHFEMVKNTHIRFQKGHFPGGYLRVGMNPPDGLLGSLTKKELVTLEKCWFELAKNADRHGIRLILRCLRSDRYRHIIKRIKARACITDADELVHNSIAVFYGRRVIYAVTELIANARNDEALMGYVVSQFSLLDRLGLCQHDLKGMRKPAMQYVEAAMGDHWTVFLEGSWDTFLSEILRLGLPYISCTRPRSR